MRSAERGINFQVRLSTKNGGHIYQRCWKHSEISLQPHMRVDPDVVVKLRSLYVSRIILFATSKNGGSINGCAIDGNLNGMGIIIVRFWL